MKPRGWYWIIAAMLAIAVTVIVMIGYPAGSGVTPVSEKEEIAAAESLLARTLSGRRYFKAPLSGISEQGGPWISAADARSQIPEIAAERKLESERVREIELLVRQMTEPHPSRMVGGERINLLRLNLSLDSLKDQ